MSRYPRINELADQGDPKDLFRVQQSLRSILSRASSVFAALFIVVLINIFFDSPIELSEWNKFLPDIDLRWLGIFPAVLLLNEVRRYHDVLYVFGREGVTQYQGRLSLNKRVPHVKYVDIISLRVHQDPWGRLLDYGDIDLDTAADAGVEIVIGGVAKPDELCKLLEELRYRAIKNLPLST